MGRTTPRCFILYEAEIPVVAFLPLNAFKVRLCGTVLVYLLLLTFGKYLRMM